MGKSGKHPRWQTPIPTTIRPGTVLLNVLYLFQVTLSRACCPRRRKRGDFSSPPPVPAPRRCYSGTSPKRISRLSAQIRANGLAREPRARGPRYGPSLHCAKGCHPTGWGEAGTAGRRPQLKSACRGPAYARFVGSGGPSSTFCVCRFRDRDAASGDLLDFLHFFYSRPRLLS